MERYSQAHYLNQVKCTFHNDQESKGVPSKKLMRLSKRKF